MKQFSKNITILASSILLAGLAGSTAFAIEYDPDGPTMEEASWSSQRNGGKLHVHGDTETDSREKVEIRNAVTQDVLFTVTSDKQGEFEAERHLKADPCLVQAGVDGVFGPAAEVEGATEECVGEDTGGNIL